jgi:pyruvate/2-oxoglutarate/acetoin dehydrogenase E1 component
MTLVTYGGMTAMVEAAMQRLVEEDELRFDYFILTQLWPQRLDAVIHSAARTKKLVVVEESVPDFGVAAAVISEVVQRTGPVACRAVGCEAIPIPAVRHLEDCVLPSTERIVTTMREIS